jgi:hypothetical protein
MTAKPLTERMYIKPNMRVLILNAPQGYDAQLEPLPEGVTLASQPDGLYDVVQVFCYNQHDADTLTLPAIAAVKPGGALWLCYPKGTAKIKTDINRDKGWEVVTKAGWGGVRQLSIDDTWSTLMFRPEKDVKRKVDSKARP